MFCREQFLKCPPDSITKSQLLNRDSKATDDDVRKVRQRVVYKKSTLDDSSNWMTDDGDESSNDEEIAPRRRRRFLGIREEIKLIAMREIYEAQTDEVKHVILDLYKMKMAERKFKRKRQSTKSAALIVKKKRKRINNNNGKGFNKPVATGRGGAIQLNFKILARIQRRRRCRGKPQSQKKRKKFPRRKRPVCAKKGNRQRKKRFFRAQKFFEKGIFLTGRKLLDEVWQAVKDPKSTATSFCNNNIHCLSKAHRKQIALYEKIEEDLSRLDISRQERADAAVERKEKEKEKEALRQGLKNKIEARATARVERDAMRKERRAARKARALDKKMRKERAKAEEIKYRDARTKEATS